MALLANNSFTISGLNNGSSYKVIVAEIDYANNVSASKQLIFVK